LTLLGHPSVVKEHENDGRKTRVRLNPKLQRNKKNNKQEEEESRRRKKKKKTTEEKMGDGQGSG